MSDWERDTATWSRSKASCLHCTPCPWLENPFEPQKTTSEENGPGPEPRASTRAGETACESPSIVRGQRECTAGWSGYWHAREVPGRCAGRRRRTGGGWRSCGATCAG